ncbi:MAG: hypothetical protein PWP51_1866 [Clostridiales bacterium]|nr:hypothetical protein [Clostridiales bacterium]
MQKALETPYYAVIFTSKRTDGDHGYGEASENVVGIVSKFEGFLGAESVRDSNGLGITISYWESMAHIDKWRQNAVHSSAKSMGRETWYSSYRIRICEVKYENSFQHPEHQ